MVDRLSNWGVEPMIKHVLLGFATVTLAVTPALAGLSDFTLGGIDDWLTLGGTDFSLYASPVPGPIVGAGIPGLVMAGGALLVWWRQKRQG